MESKMAVFMGFSASGAKSVDAGRRPKTQFCIQVQNVE